jgi:hypothetical protein
VAYVVCKVLSVAMPIANLLFMDVVLGNVQYWRYGVDVLWAAYRRHIGDKSDINDVIFDDDERRHPSGGRHFPRVTLCDLDIRSLGNVNRYTIQCVLTANLFIERIYTILWFVFVTLSLTSLVGLVVFLIRIARQNRQKYVAKIFRSLPMTLLLSAGFDRRNSVHNYILQHFVDDYLTYDGFLVLHLIGCHGSRTVVGDVLMEMWQLYAEKPEVKMLRDECEAIEKAARLSENFAPDDDVMMSVVAEDEELT